MHHKTYNMEILFTDEEIEDAVLYSNFHGKYKKYKSAGKLKKYLQKVFNALRAAKDTETLKSIQTLRYEKMKYDKSGFSSVRIGYNSKYRLIFTENELGITIELIEIREHYGDK